MTLRQIAASLGVAPSTVSLVLNNKTGVRKELRERIRSVLLENGYTIKEQEAAGPAPEPLTAKTILFIYYTSTNYLAARKDNTLFSIIEGIDDVCKGRGYRYSVANADASTLDDLLCNTPAEQYAGIILLGTEYYEPPTAAFLQTRIPLVILDGYFPEFPLNTINIDNSYGVASAMDLLLEKGHREIGYLKSNLEYGCLRDRSTCIRENFSRHDLQPSCIIEVEQQPDSIKQALLDFIASGAAMPTAFIADNDIIAVSAMQALMQKGYRIPEDISMIGFDDSAIATIFTPNLTTIHHHMGEMAKAAAKMIIGLAQSAEKPVTFSRSQIGTRLVIRDTVAQRREG